jgi:hypothetical protein
MTAGAQGVPQVFVVCDQGTGQPQTDGIRLAGDTTARDEDGDIYLAAQPGVAQRADQGVKVTQAGEIFFDIFAVDDKLAGGRFVQIDANTGRGTLATADPFKIFATFDLQVSRFFHLNFSYNSKTAGI